MELFSELERICRAMSEPGFYPHPVSCIQRIDTHISTVFLTGDFVYKLKKPVDFGFLDFTTLEARRYYCEQEILLNQRLSHGIYLGVGRILRDSAGRVSLEGRGEVVEYAVIMRQLPDEANLKVLLQSEGTGMECGALGRARGSIALADMAELGRHLAAFYARSAQSPDIDRYGGWDVIDFNIEENFQQMQPFIGEFVPEEEWDFIRQVSRTFFRNWRSLFEKRVQSGRIRDGHGDLRTEHIYFHDGVQIIDCIEFNERFRYGDVVSDLAFLHMDLEHLGFPELSRIVLSSYVRYASDPELYSLLDFYSAYRAIVKLKVNCLRSMEVDAVELRRRLKEKAGEYLNLAYRYAVQFSRPTLWIFCGLPATGKSALACRLSHALSLSLFQSDNLRKELEGLPQSQAMVAPYDQGLYRRERRNMVYSKMLALAQEQLKSGHSAILDASFSKRKWREDARQLALDADTNFIAVECVSEEGTMRKRLKERESLSCTSDARLQHLPQMLRDFEPLTEIPEMNYLRLATDESLDESFLELLSKSYALKCAQVRELLQTRL